MAKTKTATKKRKVLIQAIGKATIHATFNNIIINITNTKGDTISWSSAGKMGFRGSKKNTPYAATRVAYDCGNSSFELGVRKIDVYVKGPGVGRDAAIRTLNNVGLEIQNIYEVTPLPHNGCRPPKRRRV